MLPIIFDLVGQGLGSGLETETTSMFTRSNANIPTIPYGTNQNDSYLPTCQVYIPDIIWFTEGAHDIATQEQGMRVYVPDPNPKGIR